MLVLFDLLDDFVFDDHAPSLASTKPRRVLDREVAGAARRLIGYCLGSHSRDTPRRIT